MNLGDALTMYRDISISIVSFWPTRSLAVRTSALHRPSFAAVVRSVRVVQHVSDPRQVHPSVRHAVVYERGAGRARRNVYVWHVRSVAPRQAVGREKRVRKQKRNDLSSGVDHARKPHLRNRVCTTYCYCIIFCTYIWDRIREGRNKAGEGSKFYPKYF